MSDGWILLKSPQKMPIFEVSYHNWESLTTNHCSLDRGTWDPDEAMPFLVIPVFPRVNIVCVHVSMCIDCDSKATEGGNT